MPRPIEPSGPPPKPALAPTPKSLALANRVTAPIAVAAHPISKGSVAPRNVPALENRVQTPISVAKTVPTHYQAVRDTFAHQPTAVQAKILQGVKAGKADSVTARAVSDAVKALPDSQRSALVQRVIGTSGSGIGGLLHAINPETLFQGMGAKGVGGPSVGIPAGAAAISNRSFANAQLAGKVVKNAGTDLWTMGPNTVEGGAMIASDLAHGHVGNAFHAFVDPFVQTAEHLPQSLVNHPVNTLMMAAGPEGILGRGFGGIARSGIVGDAAKAAASTTRAPLALGTVGDATAPLFEERNYSPNVFHKGIQVSREKYLRGKGQDPNIARPAPRFMGPKLQYAFNLGAQAKLYRRADELTAVQGQMLPRGERSRVLDAVRQVAPDKNVRNIVSHILQGVIRTPETATEDISKEITRLREAQTGKRTVQDLWNKRQVRDLSTALQHPDKLHEAFDAAARLRPLIKAQDTYLVAHGLLDPEQASRRALLSYAMAHMGADHNGSAFVHPNGNPLSDAEILDHLQGWRNIESPNPERAEAQSARNQAAIDHNENLASHHAATEAHRNAGIEHQQAKDEFGAAGGPTPKEERLIGLVTHLRDRPGTPGEGAAAQARLDAIWAKIKARGHAGIPRDRLTAAERALDAAVSHRAVTRRSVQDSAKALRDAERKVRDTPTTTTIRVHSGVETPDPAYIGHFPGKVAPHRFYSAYKLARGTLGDSNKAFRGTAFKRGGYDHSYEGIAGQMASRAQAVAKAGLHDRVVNEMGIKMPRAMQNKLLRDLHRDVRAGRRSQASANKEAALIRQGLFTGDEARTFAEAARTEDNHNPTGALDLTAISAHPVSALDHVKDLQNPAELNDLSALETRALNGAIEDAKHSTARNVTLIPTHAANRFQEQFAAGDKTMRAIGRATQQFRRTVLPYSTHWMTQIASEAGLRGLLAGALDPRYLNDGRRLVARLEKTEQGRRALAEMVNSTFYNSKDPLSIHTERGALSSLGQALPPTKALIFAHNRYANLIGHAMYGLEHNARVMGLGKLAHREVSEFARSWQNAVHLQGQAIEELARRLESNPALVTKLGRSIDNTFGKYNKFTPLQRSAIQSYAPFLPWYLNASKYVLWHLPRNNPVASSLLASLRQTVNQDIADGKKLPLNAWVMQALARFSPFGIFTPETTTPSVSAALQGQDFIPGAVLVPQLQGALYNLAGVNSFGEGPLTSPSGDAKAKSNAAAGAAGESALEAIVPLASRIRAALEGGKPAYGTSTLWNPQPKPGEQGTSILNRILNPAYGAERSAQSASAPEYGPASSQAAGGSGSWGSWGGSGSWAGGGWG